jgi:hypothetical protein
LVDENFFFPQFRVENRPGHANDVQDEEKEDAQPADAMQHPAPLTERTAITEGFCKRED